MSRRGPSIPVPATSGGAMLNLLRRPCLRSRHTRIPAVSLRVAMLTAPICFIFSDERGKPRTRADSAIFDGIRSKTRG